MSDIKIHACIRCQAIYTEQKTLHCKEKGCDRTEQAVIVCNAKLFWGRIKGALDSGIVGDVYGTIRRAGRRMEKVQIKETIVPPKQFTGDISE